MASKEKKSPRVRRAEDIDEESIVLLKREVYGPEHDEFRKSRCRTVTFVFSDANSLASH
jgi:hypothetical protein